MINRPHDYYTAGRLAAEAAAQGRHVDMVFQERWFRMASRGETESEADRQSAKAEFERGRSDAKAGKRADLKLW